MQKKRKSSLQDQAISNELKIYSTVQAAKLLGITPYVLRGFISEGLLKAYQFKRKGKYTITHEALLKFRDILNGNN
ncbi:MAG: helix-turn-helix domain-containing protein [Mesoflavibacter sp.]|nr:helix-turn-helix domain-containing protein [Mesoflavibacter sp.]